MASTGSSEVWIFGILLSGMLLLGFGAARWRRPPTLYTLEEWGVGGRAFGNWVTWFLLGGSMYTAYTYVAVPALVYGAGAIGYFAVPFAIICAPMMYFISTRVWSVSHVHGFVTSAEFVRARFGSRNLGALVAVTGIVATMPYIAVQLIALQAMFKTIGITGDWPMIVAVTTASICTFKSGLRAPALLSIAKDVLLVWLVLSVLLMIAMTGGMRAAFREADVRFSNDISPVSGILLPEAGYSGYLTLIIGSALAIFAYPHAVTCILAARDRATIRRNAAALPVYCLALALLAMLGFYAIGQGILPLGADPATGNPGDLNTVVPNLFHEVFPSWSAGIAYAAIAVAALIPAAVMSIAAANLFTRCVYREYLRPGASPAEEAAVSRYASLLVKFGAVAFIMLLNPQFSIELQLIGGVLILQTIPAGLIGLWTGWFHRGALVAGLLAGLGSGLLLLYQIPLKSATGTVIKAHFGGSSWPLERFGLDTPATVYVGLVALAVNLVVTVAGTLILRGLRVPAGLDATQPSDYLADADDPTFRRLDDLVDGLPQQRVGAHAR